MQTATAQAGLNRETAITQQQLNMINQQTPYGSLTYSQTGQNFTPSANGQAYYYNAGTDEYRSDAPVTGTTTSTSPGRTFMSRDGETSTLGGRTTTSQQIDPAWQRVTGSMTPSYTATTSLSPEQQAILGQTQGAQLNLASLANQQSGFLKDYLGKGVDTTGVPSLIGNPGLATSIGGGYDTSFGRNIGGTFTNNVDLAKSYAGADDFSGDRQKVEDAILGRLQPQMQQDQDTLRNTLINQGIRPGTAAWDAEWNRNQQGVNDARLGAVLAGGQEQSRMVGLARDAALFGNDAALAGANFGNNASLAQAQFGSQQQQNQNTAALAQGQFGNNALLANAQFQNGARAQGLQESYAARNQPLNEIAALLGGSQVTQPQFQQTPQTGVGGVDYMGLVGDNYAAQSQASGAAMGGLFGLLSAPFKLAAGPAGIASDRRVKRDIKLIGYRGRLPWYEFNYAWEPADAPRHEGLMADEVRRIAPDAVALGPDGYELVDYAMALEAA